MKLKKNVKIIIVLIIILSISLIGYKRYTYINSYDYKLLQVGYSDNEINILKIELTTKDLDKLLLEEYNESLVKFISEKYFIYSNLNRYLKYREDHENLEYNEIVTIVNVNRDREYYTDVIKTDTNKGHLMLVNKYFQLDKDYTPKDIIKASGVYAYANNSLSEEAYMAFKKLNKAATDSGYTILINSSYRDFKSQDDIWTKRKDYYGEDFADKYAARAGHSEHQTAYAIDVADFYDVNDKFGDTEAFIWMRDNSHKYGFILRYPKGKENITGYSYEPWHYRYVGIDVASVIYNENITFDEYYAYYIENK